MDENDPALASLFALSAPALAATGTADSTEVQSKQASAVGQHSAPDPEASKHEPPKQAVKHRRGALQEVGNAGNTWSSDLAKLRSEFDSLQQQLISLPTSVGRRESLIGAGASQIVKQLTSGTSLPSSNPQTTMPATHAALPLPVAAAPAVTNTWTHRPELPDLSTTSSHQPITSVTMQPPPPLQVPVTTTQSSLSLQLSKPSPSAVPTAAAAPASTPAPTFSTTATELAARAAPAMSEHCPLGGSGSSGSSKDALFTFGAAPVANSQVWQAAHSILLDSELTSLCEEGLHKQLQRTKDGATEASRIQELAGLVKLLRKAVREMGGRVSSYVEQCVRLEREQSKQVESLRLSHESAVLALEAELAGAKKAQAGWEAERKADKATWGAELESARYESARLRRELDRVTEERDTARQDAARENQNRQQAELELKELRKVSSQAMREVAVTQNEAVKSISDEKAAAERREAGLREESARLTQRLDAATVCVEALQTELALLQQVHESTKDALRQKTLAADTLKDQNTQLQGQCTSLDVTVKQLHSQVQQLEQQLSDASASRQQLEQQLADSQQQHKTALQQVEGLTAQLESMKQTVESQTATMEAASSAAAQREALLAEEKTYLKAALAEQLAQQERNAAALAVALRQAAQRGEEITNLKHQAEFNEGVLQEAEAKVAAATQETQRLTSELSVLRAELELKDERLSVLEGEFAALKEVLGEAGGQKDVVVGLLSRISTLQAAAAAAEATRRKLHNELVTLRGNIRVYCRVRPHASPVVQCSPDQTSIQIQVEGREHPFSYDRVYPPGCSQEEVFSGVSELVQSALDGYHVCLFSYGQTGAGKTYTMQGTNDPSGRGIIPRAVEKILMTATALQQQAEWEYQMEASFVEVYNNALRDLLAGPSAPYINEQSAIKHDPNGGHTTVVGVVKVPVADAACAETLLRRAAANRACETTAMNAESSRSHCVFMLYIRGSHPPSGTQLQGCLCLVDLAGSERLDRSQAEDARKKEACAINQSLSALGDVFAALSAKQAHVPYRNSKLTYLLQPCLGGQGKTLMFVNINPEPASAFESLCSLKFAAKVNGCEQGNGKGPAVRRVTGPSASGSSTGAASGSGLRSASDDVKRLSLPGPARIGGGMSSGATGTGGEPATKRMSMYGGSGPGAAGIKRPPPAASAAQAQKRARQ